MKHYKFTVEGQPLPRPRPRISGKRMFFPKKYQDYLESMKEIIGWKMKQKKWTPLKKDVYLEVAFHRQKKQRADIDNLLKVAMESLEQSGVIGNDNQVIYTKAGIIYNSKKPRVEVEVWE